MKLALAIVLCIGLYLCAVSALEGQDREEGGGKAGDGEEGGGEEEDEEEEDGEEEDEKTSNAIKYPAEYEYFEDHYGTLVEDVTKCFPNTKLTKNGKGFDEYVKWLKPRYDKFIRTSLSPISGKKKYKLLRKPERNLKKADLEFQRKCVFEFQAKFFEKSDPPIDLRQLGWDKINNEMIHTAYGILVKQIENFIEDLNESGIGPDAQTELEEFSKEHDFSQFFGYWFKPDCDPKAMNEAIQNMKGEHNLDNDKAAKVMVLLRKFKGGKKDDSYLPRLLNIKKLGRSIKNSLLRRTPKRK